MTLESKCMLCVLKLKIVVICPRGEQMHSFLDIFFVFSKVVTKLNCVAVNVLSSIFIL